MRIYDRWNSSFVASRWPLVSGALLLVVTAGCGTADYNRLLNTTMGDLRSAEPFRALFAPTELADTPVSIRVPSAFTKSYREGSEQAEDGGVISAERLQPPFMKLPGFKICYEGRHQDPIAGAVPFYCYLAAIPSKPGDAPKRAASLQEELRQSFKVGEWEPIDCPTPDGKAANWKRLTMIGDQTFRVIDGGQVVSKKMAGEFQLWMYDGPDHIVLVGWRAPEVAVKSGAGDKADFTTWPNLTCGTIKWAEPAPATP